MKVSTETYQYQSYSGQYERFAPGYVQPDYALLIDAKISYFIIIVTLK